MYFVCECNAKEQRKRNTKRILFKGKILYKYTYLNRFISCGKKCIIPDIIKVPPENHFSTALIKQGFHYSIDPFKQQENCCRHSEYC